MTSVLGRAMQEALQLTRAQKLGEATRIIQRALSGHGRPEPPEEPPGGGRLIAPPPLETPENEGAAEPAPETDARAPEVTAERPPAEGPRRGLGEVLKLLREAKRPGAGFEFATARQLRKAPLIPVPDGAVYVTKTFACAAGSRDYRLYVPSRADGRALPLLVMLHGCTQDPDDFAAGTAMNRLAEEQGFLVAYPRQPPSANPSACWNWFNPKDQRRGEGEPSIIAGITRSLLSEFAVDGSRVYVAGLSAGGAMAAIMAALYPELYAAAGIHSGLAYGSAADLPSALAAMRGGASGAPAAMPTRAKPRAGRRNGSVRTIVFHGANDKTVNPSNAAAILAEARAGLAAQMHETRKRGVAGGRAYTRTVIADASGVVRAEGWAIEELGHAWSGGSPDGSYADPHGPDASREMLRFFLEAPPERRA